jgi:hypothetical protein
VPPFLVIRPCCAFFYVAEKSESFDHTHFDF